MSVPQLVIFGFCVALIIVILLCVAVITARAIKEQEREERELLNQKREKEARDALQKSIFINIILERDIKDKEDK